MSKPPFHVPAGQTDFCGPDVCGSPMASWPCGDLCDLSTARCAARTPDVRVTSGVLAGPRMGSPQAAAIYTMRSRQTEAFQGSLRGGALKTRAVHALRGRFTAPRAVPLSDDTNPSQGQQKDIRFGLYRPTLSTTELVEKNTQVAATRANCLHWTLQVREALVLEGVTVADPRPDHIHHRGTENPTCSPRKHPEG
eukprot:CAMPEP_0195098826 /NCGR_PEP_ID=MMETSP0448-20130528/57902_1 /TAXON_ID=66468 /ORGANISM="Heterocapsa triquestra, Strain CCMP 448" /LENGTH=194 /DNA_ID=CAMNT_0040133599 /DNA_START=27 /DNA_END=609 /DNA_ORIENTATION=+